jgi:hypothetical protein
VNPYDILQVSPKADAQVIRAAYRSLMQRYHPDKNPLDAQAAQMSISINSAYELLCDPHRKAVLDAELASSVAEPRSTATAPAQKAPRIQRGGKNVNGITKRYAVLMPIAALLACVALVWGAVSGLRQDPSAASPATQLSGIRTQIENPKTTETERRRLFALKQNLLEQHADLAAAERSERLDDLAARSLALLTEPLTVRLTPLPSSELPSTQLLLPEITLVLGSFDAQKLQAHVAKHRARIVDDLRQQLALQSAVLPLGLDAEVRIKRVVRDAVMASLEIRAQETYPSTYFESPARHGVVDVIFPNGFAALK